MTTKLWREVKKIGVNQMNVTQKKITVYLKPASTYASISNDKIRLSWFVAPMPNIVYTHFIDQYLTLIDTLCLYEMDHNQINIR